MWLFVIKVSLIVLTVILKSSKAEECGPTLCNCSPETLAYRTIDGTCNNLNHITWGAAGRPYDRLTSGWFDTDGISIAKSTCATNQDLPSARSVRLNVYTDDEIATDFSHTRNILSSLKFFIADIGNLKQFAAPAPCCSCNFQQLPDPPPYCSYIQIPVNDPVYTEVGAKCMAVIKGISNLDLNCSYAYGSGPGYISTATFWMDMSQLYGSCEAENSAVRKFELGELNLENRGGNYYYRNSTSRSQCAIPPGTDEVCYATADPNGNRLPDFTAYLTVAAREHNRIARILRNINKCWDDEKIYQESRRIHIAVYQHIIFDQVLPFVLGKQNMIDAGLINPYSVCSSDYDPNSNPDLAIEFSHGAMKGLHTMARGRVVLMTDKMEVTGILSLSDYLNRPSFLEDNNNFDKAIYGFCGAKVNAVGGTVDSVLLNHFDMQCLKVASDWLAMDIQRNRLLGVPSYNDIIEFQGRPRAIKFSDLLSVMTSSNVNKLSSIYSCPDDIELHAAILEIPVPGSKFGPTFHKMVLEQLLRTRNGDRFWYEFPSSGFSDDQIKEIKKMTLARIYCNSGNDIQNMQKDVMQPTDSTTNPIMHCSLIPDINYDLWKDDLCEPDKY